MTRASRRWPAKLSLGLDPRAAGASLLSRVTGAASSFGGGTRGAVARGDQIVFELLLLFVRKHRALALGREVVDRGIGCRRHMVGHGSGRAVGENHAAGHEQRRRQNPASPLLLRLRNQPHAASTLAARPLPALEVSTRRQNCCQFKQLHGAALVLQYDQSKG